MKPKILITRWVPESVMSFIGKQCDVDFNREDRGLSPQGLAERLKDCEGVLCHITDRIDEALLEQTKRLRVVSNIAVGYDNIDVPAATRRGILVTNTPGVLTDTTADLAFALLLAAARRIVEADRFARSGQWKEWRLDLMLGTDVHHATLGIIGLGRIGRAVARRAKGFEMRTIYTSPRRAASEIEAELRATFSDVQTLLHESDFISLHVPLTADTRHLIGRAELEMMKPTAILINTTRGPVIDEGALAEALREGSIAAAGLDVFEREPQIHPDLLALPNVVLAPHIGSASRQTRLRMAEVAAENLVAAVTGKVPANLVNPAAGAPLRA